VIAVLSGLIALGARALASPSGQACGDGCPPGSEAGGDDACGDVACDDAGAPDGDERTRSSADVGAVLTDGAFATVAGAVDADVAHDAAVRRARPWRWGRLDVAIAWRRTTALATPVAARLASTTAARTGDEVWLVATWRH